MSSLRILFVEDNELVRRSLVRVLRRGGHDVVACATSDEALAALVPGVGFDLVLADFDLGHMTSDALLVQVRDRLPATRVMLLTAAPLRMVPKDIACISKPVAAAELLRMILPDAA
jgi:CheY-like chemotaxis protein